MRLLLSGRPPSTRLEELAEASSGERSYLPQFGLVDVNGWALAGGLGGLIFSLAVWLFSSEAFSWDEVLSLVTFISGAGSLVGFSMGLIARLYGRARRREVDRQLRVALRSRPVSPQVSDDEQLLQSVQDSKFETYAIKEAESYLTVESSETAAVEEYLQRYPPRFPRGAKRMLNHARLQTKIARERGMFGGSPELTAEHLGKWIVLNERWPEFAVAVATRHHEIGTESDLVDLYGETVSENRELRKLLDDRPELAGVLERLIFFTPAAATGVAESVGAER
jgi:hypothetical protein